MFCRYARRFPTKFLSRSLIRLKQVLKESTLKSSQCGAFGNPLRRYYLDALKPVSAKPQGLMLKIFSPETEQCSHSINMITQSDTCIDITWGDGHKSQFHHFWLRDNCRCSACHHPIAMERMVDTVSIPSDVKPTEIRVFTDKDSDSHIEKLEIIWPNTDVSSPHRSVFPISWLRDHCYSRVPSESSYDCSVWRTDEIQNTLPKIPYHEVMANDASFGQWLDMLHEFGFSIIHGAPNIDGVPESIAQKISFLRTTFWGDSWTVKSEPDPANLSLTGCELFPHTDFVWSDTPPGLQFLHCVKFRGLDTGGDSTLVDGYAVTETLRESNPESFRLLCEVPIPFYFRSKDQSYFCRDSIVKLDSNGLVRSVRFNQANRAPLDVSPALQEKLHRAVVEFGAMTRDPKFMLKFRLREGDVLVFNNHRLLHGRTSYDPQKTARHLNGCYLDMEQFESRYSLLNGSCMSSARRIKKSRNNRNQRARLFSTSNANPSASTPLDPGFDNYTDQFVKDALSKWNKVIEHDERMPDGSSLKEVVDNGCVKFTSMDKGTTADYIFQCSLYTHDAQHNLVNRLIGMMKKLEGEHIKKGTGTPVDLYEHGLQCASRAYRDGADKELVVVALLHDIGEMLCPINHGEIAASILRPFISPEAYWIVANHEVFQGYYYFHHCGGNRHTRDIYKSHPQYQDTIDFCEKWDQSSFDPNYESLPLSEFEPMMKEIFSRKAYFFQPNHPKLGVVTVQTDPESAPVAPEVIEN